MKRILNIILTTGIIYALSACNDFLDLQPVSQSIAVSNTSADSILYKTPAEVEAALAGVYDDFRNEYFSLDYYVNGDAQSDDAYAGADNPMNFQIDEFSIDATNTNVSRDWAYLYGTIGKANSVYNNVDKVPGLSDARKIEIKAEAAWIRAFMYFQAVQLWGDVPLQLKEVTTVSVDLLPEIYPIMFPARAPKDSVFAQIIRDFELARNHARITAPHKGYATRGAANAMLAKVYATIQPPQWDKVLQYCDAVIAGGYSLLPDYEMLWNNQHENSAESIFEINYEGTPSSGNWGTTMFRGLDWKKFNTPSNDLVAAFDAENDMIRKNASIIFLDVSGRWSDPYWPQTNFPFVNKWRNFTMPSPQNFILLRLADILLLKAEALNAQGDVQGAAALVNQIRARVNLPPTTASNQAEMRLAIEKERRLELAFEGHRWYDLKRTGRAIEVMNNVKGPNNTPLNYNVTPNKLLWPIPQREIDNNTKLTQNPGY
ncbi:MAG: RagB/SusD family nutrient uptake outer membrane protein [Bacteroidetes bacterium]|nr:RagB/SusD family nutrient uptake outer membrane protein [Bacteroidota bacterium]